MYYTNPKGGPHHCVSAISYLSQTYVHKRGLSNGSIKMLAALSVPIGIEIYPL